MKSAFKPNTIQQFEDDQFRRNIGAERVWQAPGPTLPTIGARIASRLEAINMTQSELARRAGISQQSINSLINSKQAGSAYLVPIARALGVSAEWLYDEGEGRRE